MTNTPFRAMFRTQKVPLSSILVIVDNIAALIRPVLICSWIGSSRGDYVFVKEVGYRLHSLPLFIPVNTIKSIGTRMGLTSKVSISSSLVCCDREFLRKDGI
jgi:hypothetical protein